MFHHSQTPASPEKGNGVTLHISCQKNVIEPGRIVGPALENHSVRHGETRNRPDEACDLASAS